MGPRDGADSCLTNVHQGSHVAILPFPKLELVAPFWYSPLEGTPNLSLMHCLDIARSQSRNWPEQKAFFTGDRSCEHLATKL